MLSQGGRFGGYSLFVQQDRLHFAYNFLGLERYTISANEALPASAATLRLEFTATDRGKGVAALFVNGKKVGEGPIARTVPVTFGLAEGITAGRDPATPVTESYQPPYAFTGTLKKVVLALTPESKK